MRLITRNPMTIKLTKDIPLTEAIDVATEAIDCQVYRVNGTKETKFIGKRLPNGTPVQC